MQLLGSLHGKLLLKLGLAALRQGVAAAQLRRRLLEQAGRLAQADLSRAVLRGWHAAAVPSPQLEAEAAALAQRLCERHQRAKLAAWQRWAAHRAWQRRQVAHGQQQLRRRLLLAAVQHWRCCCQHRLVERLQAALAARWAAAWGQRRLFAAWRQAAQRSAALKVALLTRSSSREHEARRQLPTQLEALAATAAAFQPVKEFVAEAAEHLARMQQGLRSWVPGAGDAAEAQKADGRSQLPEEPAPLGSLEALLAAARPPAKQLLLLPAPAQAPLAAGDVAAAAAVLERDRPGDWHDHPAAAAGAGPAAAAPAPDPGSPPPAYNPSSYASPARHHHQQQWQQQGPRRPGSTAAEPPAAVEAELLECQEQVERLRQELASLEQASSGRASAGPSA